VVTAAAGGVRLVDSNADLDRRLASARPLDVEMPEHLEHLQAARQG
jgi:hypothetical protein